MCKDVPSPEIIMIGERTKSSFHHLFVGKRLWSPYIERSEILEILYATGVDCDMIIAEVGSPIL